MAKTNKGKVDAGGAHESAKGAVCAGVKAPATAAAKSAPKPQASAKTVAKGGAHKTAPHKSGAGAAPIDTANAAASAARLLAAGLGGKQKRAGGAGPESALFKQIKSGASGSTEKHLANFLDRTTPAGTKRLDQPGGGGGPVHGHNQTVGGDATRINVPRRTGG